MKIFQAVVALFFACAAAPAAANTLLFSSTDVFGNAAGQVDPGGNDVLGDGFVKVSDQSTNRFNHTMSLGGVTGITQIDLTLDFEDAGPKCPFGFCSIGETWAVRANGSNDSGSSDDTFATLADGLAPQTFTFSAATDVGLTDTFATWTAADELSFWFAESSGGSDKFDLMSARVDVYGEQPAPIPLPAAGWLLMASLGGLFVFGRRRNTA